MTIRDTHSPTRQEISDRQEKYADDMERLQNELSDVADDIRSIRDLIDRLDPGGGTAEGMDEAKESVDRAEGVAENVFDGRDGDLDRVKHENEEYGDAMDERARIAEKNLGNLRDTTAPIKTHEVASETRPAKEAMLQDVEMLQGVVRRIKDAAVHNVEVQERLRQTRRSQR